MSHSCTWTLSRCCLARCEADQRSRSCFAVSRWDRMLIFTGCNVAALACFVLCFALWPVLWMKPRKFAIL